jgi:glycosyltransferase involved in cell wall biosynthesis
MDKSFAPLAEKSIFMVWGPPSHGPRSKVFARELGIGDVDFIYATNKRGLAAAPYKYTYQAIQTLRLLFQKRPRVVFVQSPPSYAILFVYIYCALTGANFVVDAHSDALQRAIWTRPAWLHRFLARQAVATIVTNDHFAHSIREWGAAALVIRDIPTTFTMDDSFQGLNGRFSVIVISTFAADEPLEEVLEAAAKLQDVDFYVTGKKSRANAELLNRAEANVHFTDYLPDESYYALLNSGDAVMCLTTRNHTMQRGACEALSLGKPIITSDWPILRNYFHDGTVHVPNTAEGIRQGVQQMQDSYPSYHTGIYALQMQQQQEWERKIGQITSLIYQAMAEE